MPALQACCLRHTFVLKVHVAQREELVGGRARHWVHEERELARLRCLAAVPMLWWYTASRSGHHMLDWPGRLLCIRRHKRSSWSTATLPEKSSWASSLLPKKELGESEKKWATWCDMDQTKHAKHPQKHNQDVQCAWNQAGNPTARHAEHQGSC